MDKTKIQEMSLYKDDAINHCMGIGRQFLKHFNKIMKAGGMYDPDLVHHADVEMTGWLEDVRSVTLKPKARHLTVDQYMDWFFTAGSTPEDFIDDEYIEIYSEFVIMLLDSNNRQKKVSEILEQAINKCW